MILVTGGTGLVGSHLLYKLIKGNEPVTAIYRQEKKLEITKRVFSYYTEHFQYLFDKIKWIKADLLNIPLLSIAFNDITYVYHCAAFVSFEPDKYHLLRQANIEGTSNIVNLCISHNIEKLCYVSSIATIGVTLGDNEITEDTHWNPEEDNSVYAITKYGAEMEIWRGTQEGLDAIIVNPGVIIGAGIWNYGSGGVFKRIYNGLSYYTSGSIGYIDVEDVVNTMIKLMKSTIINERFILVSENWTYKQFLQTIAKALQVKAPDKEAMKIQLAIGWRLDWLFYKLKGKRRSLTKQLAASLVSKHIFSNSKIRQYLDFEFKPIEKSITEVSQQFLKDL